MAFNNRPYHPTVNPFGYPSFSPGLEPRNYSDTPSHSGLNQQPRTILAPNWSFPTGHSLLNNTYNNIFRYAAERRWPTGSAWNDNAREHEHHDHSQQQQQQTTYSPQSSTSFLSYPSSASLQGISSPLSPFQNLNAGLSHATIADDTCHGRCGGTCAPMSLDGYPKGAPEPADIDMQDAELAGEIEGDELDDDESLDVLQKALSSSAGRWIVGVLERALQNFAPFTPSSSSSHGEAWRGDPLEPSSWVSVSAPSACFEEEAMER